MKLLKNIFACLVHEKQECVVDLVRNLNYLDPPSRILLYNGGNNGQLLEGFPFEKYGALAVPGAQPLNWGRLHDFALDCMRYALQHFSFDILTIVDSDQLGIGKDYSRYMAGYLDDESNIGMFGITGERQLADTVIDPAVTAYQEKELWEPFLNAFPNGSEKFLYWTFWPSTVFTRAASADLVHLFDSNKQLQDILQKTHIWASEEIILPTLTALLGYKIEKNPCSYDYVKYRMHYSTGELRDAINQADAFWVHPVPRAADNELRTYTTAYFDYYQKQPLNAAHTDRYISILPIIKQTEQIEGWLENDEAVLLMQAAHDVLKNRAKNTAVVEIGSYCGKSAILLGNVIRNLGSTSSRVYAVDPFEGLVGAEDQGLEQKLPTYEKFMKNITAAGLADVILPRKCKSFQVMDWRTPIGFLFIDGLHDYTNVARDFHHFQEWVIPGGYIAFHDYADYYPGVKAFVHELLSSGNYNRVSCARSMMVLEKVGETGAEKVAATEGEMAVTCIMPTADRREFVPGAIQYFLNQDYRNKELIIIDDGADKITDLVPSSPHIKYIALDRKLTVGAKRNLACRIASGEIIIHWDDDDWIAPRWIRTQVYHLLQGNADVTGLDRPYFCDVDAAKAWQYIYPGDEKAWVHGGTLCYRKKIWLKNPFPDINIAEDSAFLWSDVPKKISPHQGIDLYIARVHQHNTSPKYTNSSRWHSVPFNRIRGKLPGQGGFPA